MAFKIMFDAGHAGKYNRAPLVPEYYESDMVWKLQEYLIEEFKAYEDVQTFRTREDQNTDVDIYNRGYMAKGMDFFWSLHSNAVGNSDMKEGDAQEKVNRVDTYCPLDKRNGSHDLGKKISVAVAELMDVSGGHVKTREYPNKPGVEYYGVLRGAQNAGVPVYMLTEHSFHTNIKAAKWLLNNDNLKKLAKTEAEIIADWFGLKKKSTTNESVKPETNTSKEVYVVQKGDSLSKIAAKYNTTWQELAKYNNIDDPNKIYVGQKIKIPVKAEIKEDTKPETKPEVSYKFNVNDIVNFVGKIHYGDANAASGSACKPGKAKVTARYNGKHKYHLVAEKDGKSNVYGWVDEADIEAWEDEKPVKPETKPTVSDKIEIRDKVKVKEGVKTFSNGKPMASWVRTSTLYVRNIEKNGTIYLVSTQKIAPIYTGRVRASDVYKVK